jgi:peptidylprolyl isomerase
VDFLIKTLRAEAPTPRLNAAYYFGRTRDTTAWAPRADSVRAVLDSLSLDDPAAMHLVLGIGRLGDPADTPRLLHGMRSAEDWRTRANAVRTLSTRTDEQGIRAALYDRLVDPSMHVAVAAAQALNDGKVWSDKDVDIIKQWTKYNAYAWRITASLLVGIARQGETTFVLGEVDRSRNSRNPLGYARVLPALAYLPGPEAFDMLVNAAHSQDIRIAHTALGALMTRWKENLDRRTKQAAYLDTFADGLRRKDQALAWVSARALSDSLFRPLGALALLQHIYEDCTPAQDLDVMTAILGALGASGNPEAKAFLRREMTYPHLEILLAAGKALEQLTGKTPNMPTGHRPPERTVDWDYLRALGPHPHLVLETPKGTITLVLDAEQAPLTTQTLAQFARAGQFDDVPFHRVVPNFVIQGGDFARRDGFGGPPFRIRSEFTRIPYARGTLGMASSGKDTEGSQYFITHSMQPHLDGRYTAFGHVLDGLDVVDSIYEDDRVVKATLVPDKQP